MGCGKCAPIGSCLFVSPHVHLCSFLPLQLPHHSTTNSLVSTATSWFGHATLLGEFQRRELGVSEVSAPRMCHPGRQMISN